MTGLRAEEAAELIGCVPERVRALYRKGLLDGYKVGRLLRFDEAVVRAYAETYQPLRAPLSERLNRRLVPGPNGCKVWTGSTSRFGHGCLSVPDGTARGRRRPAHRVAWALANGPIPEGLHVLHKCDNPPCCNPEYLYLGTDADNVNDRDRQGRGYHARRDDLDLDLALRMRRDGATYSAIARALRVSVPTASRLFARGRPSLGVPPLRDLLPTNS